MGQTWLAYLLVRDCTFFTRHYTLKHWGIRGYPYFLRVSFALLYPQEDVILNQFDRFPIRYEMKC